MDPVVVVAILIVFGAVAGILGCLCLGVSREERDGP